ncbi:MAG: hypothetical protein LC637_01810 [Xanthomonadaceae bacterium]|nr:hypothetical protein [Xanthomonadaceae bacterium]
MRNVSIAVLVLVTTSLFAEQKPTANEWRVAGGQIQISINQGAIAPFGLEIEVVNALTDVAPKTPLMYRELSFEGLTIQSIGLRAPNQSIEAFTSGYLHYHGGLILRHQGRELDLVDFQIRPHPDHPEYFELLDRNGRAWAILDHGHFQFMQQASALEVRYLNLTVNQRFAEFLGYPEAEGRVIGTVGFRADVVTRAVEDPGLAGQCATPNWPTTVGFDADVAFIGMGSAVGSGVQQMRCQNCNGQSGGPVVIAPDAKLENVGTADVPWWRQFTAPTDPYGNDQHPFLVWNLYRIDEQGRLEQIGASGLKHAFFTVNTDCPCSGGNILWLGCTDTYGASTNDSSTFLGPRDEIIPVTGQWGRCNSFFDPDCDGQQEGFSSDGFQNRMRVLEADLADGSNPGARYFMEGWYVVRDDVNIFNTMGWREVNPSWSGAGWGFPTISSLEQGAFVDFWVDPLNPAPGTGSTLVNTEEGVARVMVKVTDLGKKTWRYDYAVTNHDFMRTETAGQEPALEIVSNAGFSEFTVAVPAGAVISDIDSARADRTVGADWAGSRNEEGVTWVDGGSTSLSWGTTFRFSFVSNAAPARGEATLGVASGVPDSFRVSVLAPGVSEQIFADGFE